MKKSVLLIRLSSLGDVLLTTGVIRELSEQFPDVSIDVLTSTKFAEVFTNSPYIRNCFPIDTTQSAVRMAVQRNTILKYAQEGKPYDFIIDLQNSLRSRLFTFGLSKNIARMKKYRLEKIAMVQKKEKLTLPLIPDRYRNTIQTFFQIQNDNKGLDYFNSTYTSSNNENYIGIAPGAKHFTKRLPIKIWKKVIELLNNQGFTVVLFGGKEDVSVCEGLSDDKNNKILNRSGATSLVETSEYLQQCAVVVSNDSSVGHLAASFKIPVVSIFGSTIPGFGFVPYQTQNIIVENTSASCRPCTHIGKSECPLGHFDCMNLLSPETIVESVLKLLTKNT